MCALQCRIEAHNQNHVTHSPEFSDKKLNTEKVKDLSMFTQLLQNLLYFQRASDQEDSQSIEKIRVRFLDPNTRVSDSEGLGENLTVSLSKKYPEGADASGPGTTL